MKKISRLELEESLQQLDGNLFKGVLLSKAHDCIAANMWLSDAIHEHLKFVSDMGPSVQAHAPILNNDLSIAVRNADLAMRDKVSREHEREDQRIQRIFDRDRERLSTESDLRLRNCTKFWGWILYAAILGYFHYVFWILAAGLSIYTRSESQKYDEVCNKCKDLSLQFDHEFIERCVEFREKINRIDRDCKQARKWSDNFMKIHKM